jgi:hypothetical protein
MGRSQTAVEVESGPSLESDQNPAAERGTPSPMSQGLAVGVGVRDLPGRYAEIDGDD